MNVFVPDNQGYIILVNVDEVDKDIVGSIKNIRENLSDRILVEDVQVKADLIENEDQVKDVVFIQKLWTASEVNSNRISDLLDGRSG